VSRQEAPVETPATYRKRNVSQRPLAVVISAGRYTSKIIPNSKHAATAAAAFVKFLQDDMGLPAGRIISLRDGQLSDYTTLFGTPGAPSRLLRGVLAGKTVPEVIVYFSGRAAAVENGQDVVLLPRDAHASRMLRTGYRLSDIYRNLSRLGVSRLRIYLDTSFSDPMNAQPEAGARAPSPVETRPLLGPAGTLTPPGWVVLTAATGDQPAYSEAGKPLSAFTDLLVKGLRGLADTTGKGNGDGAVTAGELVPFVRGQLDIAVQLATGGRQRPSFFGREAEILAVK